MCKKTSPNPKQEPIRCESNACDYNCIYRNDEHQNEAGCPECGYCILTCKCGYNIDGKAD